MKCNKEYYFHKSIESIDDVVEALRSAGYAPTHLRRSDLDGKTIAYRLMITDLGVEYEVITVEDCLEFIVNNTVMLGEMVKIGSIVEG